MLLPYESICLHMHAHAALTLFYKRLFFSFNLFFKFLLFLDIRFTICLDPIKIPLSCLIWVHFVWMSPITSRNHTAWGPIRRVGLLVYLFDKDNYTKDPNQVTEFCGVSFRSAIFGFLKVKIISRFWL